MNVDFSHLDARPPPFLSQCEIEVRAELRRSDVIVLKNRPQMVDVKVCKVLFPKLEPIIAHGCKQEDRRKLVRKQKNEDARR